MININYPEKVKELTNIFANHGYEAYAVGGCVRDTLMGKIPADWDITTSALPGQMTEMFENLGIRTIPTGLKHGTVTAMMGEESFECTTYRIDGTYTDSRRPDFVEFSANLEDDLSRRDFTINAMATDFHEIYDLFGGMKDINDKIIKCVGNPEVRFTEDALRILRALRFAAVLDFEIEKKTFDAIKKLSGKLDNISAERKTAELSKILCCENADRGIKLLFESGVMKYLLPDAQPSQTDITLLEDIFALRLSALMWQTGARDISRLRLSNEEKKTASMLMAPITYDSTPEGARRALAKYGKYTFAACRLQGKDELYGLCRCEEAAGHAVNIRGLAIGGSELLSLGVCSQTVGKLLNKLLEEVIKNPEMNTKDSLLYMAQKIHNA